MPLQLLAQRVGKVLKNRKPDMRIKNNSTTGGVKWKNIPNTPKSVISQRKLVIRFIKKGPFIGYSA